MPFVGANYDFDATMRYVNSHRDDDVRRLALSGKAGEGVDMAFALRQIDGWQRATAKLPSWAEKEGIIYPPHISLEQCSSEVTAHYKAGLISGETLVDLTCGFGVDATALAKRFGCVTCVETNPLLCEIVRHNLPLLGVTNVEVVCDTAERFLDVMPPVSAIYIDPSRRDVKGQRVYLIEDCAPDVAALMPILLEKAEMVLIKFSPMLDIANVLNALPSVEQVHVVSVKGECKELLALVRRGFNGNATVHCVNDEQLFVFNTGETPEMVTPMSKSLNDLVGCETVYLYEPNASVMKAGCFVQLASHFSLEPLSNNSHLFLSGRHQSDFPGRVFRLLSVTSFNRKNLKQTLGGITKANIAVRNFPMTVADLRKRLNLADGGDHYIFATRLKGEKPVLLITQKTKKE